MLGNKECSRTSGAWGNSPPYSRCVASFIDGDPFEPNDLASGNTPCNKSTNNIGTKI